MRKKSPERFRIDPAEIAEARRMPEVRFQKREKLRQIPRVGVARRQTLAALLNQMRKPGFDRALEIVPKREFGVCRQNLVDGSHCRPLMPERSVR
jgi:hypothetical protein